MPIREFKARALVALFCILASVLAVAPFFFMGQTLPGGSRWDLRMPDSHDMYLHYDQMRDFYQGLAAGELYPRWEQDTNYGFGAPTTCFYPPGVYYLTSELYPFFHDWTAVLLVAHVLMMVASGGAAYCLARRYMSRLPASIAMTAYIAFPYHAIDQYRREAIAELLSFIWMPLILLFVDRLFSAKRSLLPAAGLAMSYGAFLWSHPPTAYQFALVLCPMLPVLAALRRNWRGLVWTAGGLILGAGLSAAYMYPAAAEQNLIRHEIMDKIWPYHFTYLFMYAGYSKQYFEFFQLLNTSWRFYAVAGVIAACVLFGFGRLRRNRALRDSILFWVCIGGLASFLMLPISAPFGRMIPRIEIGVFAWRMLAITTLVAALLAGATIQLSLDARAERRRSASALLGILGIAIVSAGVFFSIFDVMAPVNNQVAFQPKPEHLNYAIIPRTAPASTSDLPRVDRIRLDGAPGSATVREWMPQHRVIDVDSRGATRLFVRTFNYPGWMAKIDGFPATLSADGATGAMLLAVPPGEHSVVIDFLDTPARRLGARISLLSFLLTLAALAIGSFKELRPARESPASSVVP